MIGAGDPGPINFSDDLIEDTDRPKIMDTSYALLLLFNNEYTTLSENFPLKKVLL